MDISIPYLNYGYPYLNYGYPWLIMDINNKLWISITMGFKCAFGFPYVSCVHQFFSVAPCRSRPHKNAAAPCWAIWIRPFLRTELVFSPENTMPMCCLCIPIYLILIRVATLPGTLVYLNSPRKQHTRIDAILKEDAKLRPPVVPVFMKPLPVYTVVAFNRSPRVAVQSTLWLWLWNTFLCFSMIPGVNEWRLRQPCYDRSSMIWR